MKVGVVGKVSFGLIAGGLFSVCSMATLFSRAKVCDLVRVLTTSCDWLREDLTLRRSGLSLENEVLLFSCFGAFSVESMWRPDAFDFSLKHMNKYLPYYQACPNFSVYP